MSHSSLTYHVQVTGVIVHEVVVVIEFSTGDAAVLYKTGSLVEDILDAKFNDRVVNTMSCQCLQPSMAMYIVGVANCCTDKIAPGVVMLSEEPGDMITCCDFVACQDEGPFSLLHYQMLIRTAPFNFYCCEKKIVVVFFKFLH